MLSNWGLTFTFIFGAGLGCIIAILLFIQHDQSFERGASRRLQKPVAPRPVVVPLKRYDQWFERNGYGRKMISNDELVYSGRTFYTETEWLYNTVTVLCAVMSTGDKYTRAVNSTWATSCNERLFYNSSIGHDKHNPNTFKTKAKSSFHALCNVIRSIPLRFSNIDWVIFVKDDMFVILENFRYLVAPLDADGGHYLGHAINFWGIDYNIAMGGFAMSKGAIKKFIEKFPDSDSCIAGGKYWKQEDLYLGKHLRSLNIFPADTRDSYGKTTFIGYDLDKVIFPNSIHEFANFYTRALYPVKCCSRRIVTFQVLSSTETYRYYYMIYQLKIFSVGTFGNRPPIVNEPEENVWQKFLKERGLPYNISSQEYENSWYSHFFNISAFNGVLDEHFKAKIKSSKNINKFLDTTHMSEILADILYNYTHSSKKT